MQPRTLTIEGLRSFKSRVEIDFGDRDLLAIVGDTGVGKSSILEAITYALYGRATWVGGHSDLISDTVEDMRVQLSFNVDGKSYVITRSASTTYRPSMAQLECLTDHTTIDDVRPVDDAVERLIGLDVDAFLKTVILPQGRFAELLESTPSRRTDVLKNVFRVDRLEQIRDSAKAILDRLTPKVQGLQERRAAYPEDPAAVIEEAQSSLERAEDAARKRQDRLREAEGLDARRGDAEHSAAKIRPALDRLDPQRPEQLRTALNQVRKAAVDLEQQREPITKRITELDDDIADLTGQLAEATKDGLDQVKLGQVHQTLTQARDELPGIANSAVQIASRSSELAAQASSLSELTEQAEAARNEADEAAGKAKSAEQELTTALQTHEQAARLLTGVRGAQGLLSEADDTLTTRTERLANLKAQREPLADKVERSHERQRRTAERLSELQRQHAAAHAATGVEPGDPCPICDQELPADFEAPQVPDLDDVEAKAEHAAEKHAEVLQDLTQLDTTISELQGQIKEAQELKQRRGKELNGRVTEFVKHLEIDRDALYVDAEDDTILADLTRMVTSHEAMFDELNLKATELDNAAKATEQEAAEFASSIKTERSSLVERRKSLAADLMRVRESISRLPVPFNVDLPSHDEVQTLDEDSLNIEVVGMTAESAEQRLGHIKTLNGQLEELNTAKRQLSDELNDLDDQVSGHVQVPLAQLRIDVTKLGGLLSQVAEVLEADVDETEVPADADVERVYQLLELLGTRLARLVDTGEQIIQESGKEAEQAAGLLAELLEQTEAESLEELKEETVAAQADVATWKGKQKTAKEQANAAAQLDEQLQAGLKLTEDLRHLKDLLGSGERGFIGHLVHRRARDLLVLASHRLDEMTDGRYAFTPEFQVLDQLTGQPRGVRTLSGGEKFLASLSLALGMVDLAARAGGRLDALFLDEGFGALDHENLNAAVDALEMTSQEGRMVAVISHVKAVADRIADVMIVTEAVDGSRAFWLGEHERAGVTGQDAEASLARLLD